MIKPDWNVFKAKFSENPQANFEWFCYMLFCKEFDLPKGVFRFKNQSAIETNPIENGSKVIGWQAKFYDTSLSGHKNEIMETLDKVKRDYPEITKLLFYTNKEWSQEKGKTPKGLTESQEKAKDLGIELEYRCASYFENESVVTQDVLIKHFFTLEKNVFTLLSDLSQHAENILSPIKTKIEFNDLAIVIDRSKEVEALKNPTHQVSILSGVGGVGKTAVIKSLYSSISGEFPFFVFKATEFEVRNINELLNGFSFYSFLDELRQEKEKVIVIDSAEKLLDLKNQEPFKEVFSALIKYNWRIILTARSQFLENLNYEFMEKFEVKPFKISITCIGGDELEEISKSHSFSLPTDRKFLTLIKNPFYLGQFLSTYRENVSLDYAEFKNRLWERVIRKSGSDREQCFLELAFNRVNTGQFYIDLSTYSSRLDLVNELVKDEILGREKGGHFIVHDIYEEWALEKRIEFEFNRYPSVQVFFQRIGQALSIRRSFRNWVSEQLFLKNGDIKRFIEEVVDSGEVETFWKDEVFVSVLLSDYSKEFFEFFSDNLLSNQQDLLKRLTFLLRISCKELDDQSFKLFGEKKGDLLSSKFVFTKPRGRGWEYLIKFVYDNLNRIGIKNANYILPLISDWNNNVKSGETTKLSSLIALKFYQLPSAEKVYRSDVGSVDKLVQTIINGALEIKHELCEIFEQILANKWRNHRDPYQELIKIVLTSIDGIYLCQKLPEYALRLANLYWTQERIGRDDYDHLGNEHYFGLRSIHPDYHPASAYQTPIFWLLQVNFKETIDFVLILINKCTKTYAESGFDPTVKKVRVFFDDGVREQYISNCLWNMYRGTGSPVSPYLLQSVHMALEKVFLDFWKNVDSETLNIILIYMLKNTESASVTALVASVVLAFPEKTFETAKILFRTKEFILYDTSRLVLEPQAKFLYCMSQNMGAPETIYDQERQKTCEDKHRQWNLERLFLNYQIFKEEETTEEQVIERKKFLWQLLDEYYHQLPTEGDQEENKVWSIFLARMDIRKMNIQTEKIESGIVIKFTPELTPELKDFSEQTTLEKTSFMRHTKIKLWAHYKLEGDDKHKDYEEYESDPIRALNEAQEIVESLNTESEDFIRFSYPIPALVCAVLVENSFEKLTSDAQMFCKDILLETALVSLKPNYFYQIGDGVQQAIIALPLVLHYFPDEKEQIKMILLTGLFNNSNVGGFLSTENFSIFSTIAIRKLWDKYHDDAHSILIGYLLLKPRHAKLALQDRRENPQYEIMRYHCNHLWNRFIKENEKDIELMFENKLSLTHLGEFEKCDLYILGTAFRLIEKAEFTELKAIAIMIISSFSKRLNKEDGDENLGYLVKYDFFRSYAAFVLKSSKADIMAYLKPVLDNLRDAELVTELLKQFVSAEDALHSYDNFWVVWDACKLKILEISTGRDSWQVGDVIESLLFASNEWKETAKEWRSFKEKEKRFFAEVFEKIGLRPSSIYAIGKLLNGIGSHFAEEGVFWISKMLESGQPEKIKLKPGTIGYLEEFTRRYALVNREKVKKSKRHKDSIVKILDFLVSQGSAIGYMLRENVI